jgi:hypothetical protein
VGLDPIRPERLPQTVDVHLERANRRRRRLVSPEGVDEAVARDDLTRPEEQRREQSSLLRRAERQAAPVVDGPDRAQDAELDSDDGPSAAILGAAGRRRRSRATSGSAPRPGDGSGETPTLSSLERPLKSPPTGR